MKRTLLLAGALPFVSAFLGSLLAFSLVAAPWATAQSTAQSTAQVNEFQEVRASGFSLVGPDGTTIARLAPSALGAGNLILYDAAGTRRSNLGGSGNLNVYDVDGDATVFRAGRTFEGTSQTPPLNGVQLGPDGTIGLIPALP